jgi:hypothetical protein
VQGDSVSWLTDLTAPTITATSAAPAAGASLAARVTFDEAISGLSAGDLSLVPASNPFVAYTPTSVQWDAASRTATFLFTGALPDGNYTAQLPDGAVTDAAGNPVVAESFTTFVLAGDANRDRIVNFDDLLLLSKNYNVTGATWAQGDFDGTGARAGPGGDVVRAAGRRERGEAGVLNHRGH